MKKLTFILAISYQLLAISFQANGQYTVLNDFDNTNLNNGFAEPYGSLTSSVTGDTLFGMTYGGGLFNYGSIFYITANGSVYDTLLSFTGASGSYPYGSLVLSGKVLYGMTLTDGPHGGGTVFSIHTDGTGFTVIYSLFGQHQSWGQWGEEPFGSLIYSDGVLFGMTSSGGNSNRGNIFRIDTGGSHFDTLHSFGYSADDGKYPLGSLTLSGNVLYGMTRNGGQYDEGIIFSIDTNGSAYDTLHNFGAGTDDGENPGGSLTVAGNVLYGMTSIGGQYNDGIIFSIHTDGSAYDTLHSFGKGSDGANPTGDLTSFGDVLLGMTSVGGKYADGIIFSIHTDGTGYDTLHNFEGNADGENPNGNITVSNGIFFGMTNAGGIANMGIIFSDSICNAFALADTSTPDNGAGNGSATVYASGGTMPYTYSWAPGGQTISSISGLSAGTYTCTVFSSMSCNQTAIVTVKSTAGINEVKGESEKVKVYPNPSNGQFAIQLAVGSGQLAVVEVYNVLGEQVCISTPAFPPPAGGGMSSVFQMNLSSQPNGIYFYRVITQQGNLVDEGKIIIQK